MYTIGEVSRLLNVHEQTIRRWEDEGKIASSKTPGGHRRYNIIEVQKLVPTAEAEKKSYIYCRVSTRKQQAELERQIHYMQEKYPGFETISDISSGVHYNRPGFRNLLEQVVRGTVKEVAFSSADRGGRFGYDLFEQICAIKGVKITISDRPPDISAQQELVEDIIAIITSFAARIHGKRKYNRKEQKNKDPIAEPNKNAPEKVDGLVTEDLQHDDI